MMYLALSYDHRAVDGKEAVTFLVKVKEAIENPTALLLDLVNDGPRIARSLLVIPIRRRKQKDLTRDVRRSLPSNRSRTFRGPRSG